MSPKEKIRREAKFRLASLDDARRRADSERVSRDIIGTGFFDRADSLWAFIPWKGEIDITPILEEALGKGKEVCLPRVEGLEMVFHRVADPAGPEMVPNAWGIPEPPAGNPRAYPEDFLNPLMIVPGLAFTPDGSRLGRGGGYYDRFLSRWTMTTIGVAYPCQIYRDLPREPHDLSVNLVFY